MGSLFLLIILHFIFNHISSSSSSSSSSFCVADVERVPIIDLAFAISATVSNPAKTFKLMKNTIRSIMDQYGAVKIHYSVIVFGNEPAIMIDFSDDFSISDLKSQVRTFPRRSGEPSITKALEKAKQLFEDRAVRADAHRILVVIIDNDSVGDPRDINKLAGAKELEKKNVLIIPVAVGTDVDTNELEKLTPYKDNVINRPRLPDPRDLATDIINKAIEGDYWLLWFTL